MMVFCGISGYTLLIILIVRRVLSLPAFKVLGAIVIHQPCHREARQDEEYLIKEPSDPVGNPLPQNPPKRSLLEGREGVGDDVLGSNEHVAKDSPHGWLAGLVVLPEASVTYSC